ncbi:MAG: phosphoribosyltransferase family protein [Synechococcaceae cyanobacterium]|nr:phosphoribosyltransferase family protein [Synechococcaceae cyanobacterium]
MAPVLLPPLWHDRRAAGRALAARFPDLRGHADDALLLALPRGGVAVAAEMADRLGLPLACWAVRKIAHPASPETAIGAVAPGGVVLWDRPERGWLRLSEAERQALVAAQQRELERRRRCFGDPEPEQLRGRHLVVVDDGIATGMTARAALQSLRRLQPASLALAVPVLDRHVRPDLEALVERLEALAVVDGLRAVGEWYERFEQLDDATVLALLEGRS